MRRGPDTDRAGLELAVGRGRRPCNCLPRPREKLGPLLPAGLGFQVQLAWTPGRGWTGSTFKEKVSVEALGPQDCLFLCLLRLQLPARLLFKVQF